MSPKAIPDRWIPYKACGNVIEGTRFICFKVPLKRSVQINIREIEKIWDIPTVLKDIPKLGAVIDLTNTARYYNPQDFLKANVLHRKILMPGRIIPPESSVKEFKQAVDEFLGKHADSLIGVHCTHGLNRTGYMVCRYMRDVLGLPAPETIHRFEQARGYKIERDIYINDLLGSKSMPIHSSNEIELIPVVSRRHDLTYRSPLGEEYAEESRDSSNRFGNSRFSHERFGDGRFSHERFGDGRFSHERFGDGRFSHERFGDGRFSHERFGDGRFNNDWYMPSRFGNDRFGYNRFNGSSNSGSQRISSGKKNSGNNGLFSCYTDRYSKDRQDCRNGEKDRAGTSSMRDREEMSWKCSQRSNRHIDSGYNKNKREDRVGFLMPDFQRTNEQPK